MLDIAEAVIQGILTTKGAPQPVDTIYLRTGSR